MANKYRSNYAAKRKQLATGLSGFICTCNSKLAERDCVRESYNILNEFADTLFGPEVGKKNEEEKPDNDEDIDTALKNEVESIKEDLNKKPEQRRFQVVESGASGLVFIRTTVPDPVKLAHVIATASSSRPKSKFLLRLIPVELTCKAYIEDICACCELLFDKYFCGEETTFAVIYNHRNNDRIKREELIEKVASLVLKRNEKHKADLKQPKLAVLIEVIRSICCLSVVPDFYSLKKYNLLELGVAAVNAQNEN